MMFIAGLTASTTAVLLKAAGCMTAVSPVVMAIETRYAQKTHERRDEK